MNKNALKSFARRARKSLIEQVASRLEYVLNSDTAELRERRKQVDDLKAQIAKSSKEQVIETAAYTWFNRLAALRFMDANGYTPVRVVSPAPGFTTPEILTEAKKGHIDDNLKLDLRKLHDLLDGKIPATDPHSEAYRLLLVAMCNYYHKKMPFLFESIQDYTELLLPVDLLSDRSVRADIVSNMPAEDCKDVEILGWLYQFYIAEKKDQVFANLAKNIKVKPQDIPAATQLFTPHWIVRYLVENSLGRIWLQNHSGSLLKEKMPYFLELEQEPDTVTIKTPEEITFCDPACGSGHILTYAFDLFAAIYEEAGYEWAKIPGLILKNNLFGLEIDRRAADIAAFALVMKAVAYHRSYFDAPVTPQIVVIEKIVFEKDELKNYLRQHPNQQLNDDVLQALALFEQADNLGSLIIPPPVPAQEIYIDLEMKGLVSDAFANETHESLLRCFRQMNLLQRKYHCVVTNPPYMGSGGMNADLSIYVNKEFPNGKSDLFACFIERCLTFTKDRTYSALITQHAWMFLSSFEKIRKKIINDVFISSMVHLGPRAFEEISGEVVQSVAFVLYNFPNDTEKGYYIRLIDIKNSTEKEKQFSNKKNRYSADQKDFLKIPSSPIAYWFNDIEYSAFQTGTIGDLYPVCIGMKTGDNDKFVRHWFEVSYENIGLYLEGIEIANNKNYTWFPYLKGGELRKWDGNYDLVLHWIDEGNNIKSHINKNGTVDSRLRPSNFKYYFKEGINWSFINAGLFGVRIHDKGFFFDVAASSIFPSSEEEIYFLAAYLNSKVVCRFLKALNPTLNIQIENIKAIPCPTKFKKETLIINARNLKKIAKSDWNSIETSWDFTISPFLDHIHYNKRIELSYTQLRGFWSESTHMMFKLENENNTICIHAFNLQNEVSPSVPLEEITLFRNPHFRYGKEKNEKELETLLLLDTIKELISFTVGCILGRYSIDKPGLILANQGETLQDYLVQIPNPTFMPDEDNILPILEGDYFNDDIVARFKKFLRVSFGEAHYEENLKYVEEAIGKDIRSFFLKDFYLDNIKRYKKRPIYWLFSSPGRSFNALIYMHRYQPDLLSRLLNEYVREYLNKLQARRHHLKTVFLSESASPRDRKNADKEIAKVEAAIKDVEAYIRLLYPLAAQKIAIDLDNGVKFNYNIFSQVLMPVSGLTS